MGADKRNGTTETPPNAAKDEAWRGDLEGCVSEIQDPQPE